MKKRVLIYYHENKLAPIGGPAGYLFNLQQELKDLQLDNLDIDFYHQPLRKIVHIFF